MECALSMAERGARVILFEASQALPQPKSSWPSLLVGDVQESRDKLNSLLSEGVDVRLGEAGLAVNEGGRVTTVLGKSAFDSVAVATGSAAVHEHLPGLRKKGTHVLDSREGFMGLREASIGYSRLALLGSGPNALEVAELLLRKGIEVTLIAKADILQDHFSADIRNSVLSAAGVFGLAVSAAPLQRIIGAERVEAVLTDGNVTPCDGVVFLPDQLPRIPQVGAVLGNSGGILVDSRMRSSVPDVYAAGDCAEYTTGFRTSPLMLLSTATVSGRVAGSNAAGGSFFFQPVGSFSKRLFGLTLVSTGLGLEEARLAGFDAVEATRRSDGETVCSIVFERGSGRVLGIQATTARPAPEIDSLATAVSMRCLLSDLVTLEVPGSTDISPIVEAAREGMKVWRKF